MSTWIATFDALLTKGWYESTCRWCGHPVVTNGLSIGDLDPTDAGTVVIESRRGEPTVVQREDVVGRIPLWRAHFHTCAARQPVWPPSGKLLSERLVRT